MPNLIYLAFCINLPILAPKTPRRSKTLKDALETKTTPGRPQDGHKMAQGGLKMAPRPQIASGWPKEASECLQEFENILQMSGVHTALV